MDMLYIIRSDKFFKTQLFRSFYGTMSTKVLFNQIYWHSKGIKGLFQILAG